MFKQCTTCKGRKLFTEFGKNESRCKSCISEKNRVYRQNNPDKMRDIKRRFWQKNRDKELERVRVWRQENQENIKDHKRKYRQENLEEVREKQRHYDRNRRTAKNGSTGSIYPKEWQALKEFYGFTCLCCGRKEPEISLSLDHVIPVKLGGSNTIENAQPLCLSCNHKKSTKVIDYRPRRASTR